jgi:hypothetical protein
MVQSKRMLLSACTVQDWLVMVVACARPLASNATMERERERDGFKLVLG